MIGGIREDARLTADEVANRARGEEYERTALPTSYPKSTDVVEDGKDRSDRSDMRVPAGAGDPLDPRDARVVDGTRATAAERYPEQTMSPVADQKLDQRLDQRPDQKLDPGAGYDQGGQLFPSNELTDLRARWDKAQIGFVDEPRAAVKHADDLVATVVKRISEQFAAERAELEHQWDRGDNVSTEDLRQALRRYRTFFDRLLAF